MGSLRAAQVGLGFGVGIIVAGATTATATSLGNLAAQTLATSATVVAACDTAIGANWDSGSISPVWLGANPASNSTYNVTRLNLTGIATACNGQSYKITVASSSGTALQEITGTISGAPGITFTIPSTNSKSIGQIIILMYGS